MPLLDLFWAMLWFFLWIMWTYLVIAVFIDIFRSSDLSGLTKAIWALFVMPVPLLGVFIYLIARGGRMQQRAIDDDAARDASTQWHIREAAGTGPGASRELAKPGKLRDDGDDHRRRVPGPGGQGPRRNREPDRSGRSRLPRRTEPPCRHQHSNPLFGAA